MQQKATAPTATELLRDLEMVRRPPAGLAAGFDIPPPARTLDQSNRSSRSFTSASNGANAKFAAYSDLGSQNLS